jgi:ABC-type multidrug transport system fused ATPase/permease subunit
MQNDGRTQSKLRIAAIIAGVVLVIAIALAIWFTIAGWWPVVLDIVLVVTALVSMVLLAALVYAVISFTRTVLNVKDEVMPVLESLKTTSNAVREGAKTASAFGVDPAVRTASVLVGAGEVASVLLGKGEAKKRADKRRKRRMEIERELADRGQLNGYR